MKKFVVFIMVAVMLLGLSGCARIEDLFRSATEPKETADLSGLPKELLEITDSLRFSLHISEDEVVGPFRAEEIPENLKLGTMEVVEEVDLSQYEQWLTITSGNGKVCLTVYDGYRDLVSYARNGKTLYYRDDDGMTLENLRRDFDDLEYQSGKWISFVSGGDPAGPLREYASDHYPAFRMNLAEGSSFRYEAYDLMDYKVTDQTETMVAGEISYYAKPDNGQREHLPSTAVPGTGAYEGWYYCTEQVRLEKQDDGAWHQIEYYNDGATVTEPAEMTTAPTVPTV